MNSRRLYQGLGFAFGFILIIYGFNWLSIGLPGARTVTSQFLALNLLIGGSALLFGSLYYLLNPSPQAQRAAPPQLVVARPEIPVGIVVEEETPPKPGFYKTIEDIGYFFTFIGLISAVSLIFQVFVPSSYNEALWWIEILLVTFGVLSYVIFHSVGRLGMLEEAQLAATAGVSKKESGSEGHSASPIRRETLAGTPPIGLNLSEFDRNSTGEYEKRLASDTYDMFRVSPELVTVWREDRQGMRSTYLAGPYELNKGMLEGHLTSGESLTVGSLSLTVDSMKGLLELMEKSTREASVSVPHEG